MKKKRGGQPGNKNGGRKPVEIERADAKLLLEIFFQPRTLAEIEKEIASGKYSICTRMIFDALKGKQPTILAVFKKIFPDNLNLGLHNDELLWKIEKETKNILKSLKGDIEPISPKGEIGHKEIDE